MESYSLRRIFINNGEHYNDILDSEDIVSLKIEKEFRNDDYKTFKKYKPSYQKQYVGNKTY